MIEKKNSPFDFVESVSETKDDLFVGGAGENEYVPFLTNRALSYHTDAVLYANEMNLWHSLPNRAQYDYYMQVLRKRRRRSKWFKPEDLDNIELISWHFKCSKKDAKQILFIMSPDDVEELKRLKESMT